MSVTGKVICTLLTLAIVVALGQITKLMFAVAYPAGMAFCAVLLTTSFVIAKVIDWRDMR